MNLSPFDTVANLFSPLRFQGRSLPSGRAARAAWKKVVSLLAESFESGIIGSAGAVGVVYSPTLFGLYDFPLDTSPSAAPAMEKGTEETGIAILEIVTPRSTEAKLVDRWAALAAVEETLSAAERRFGRTVEGMLLDHYAVEAVTDLLNAPARVTQFFPDLALRTVCDRVGASAAPGR